MLMNRSPTIEFLSMSREQPRGLDWEIEFTILLWSRKSRKAVRNGLSDKHLHSHPIRKAVRPTKGGLQDYKA